MKRIISWCLVLVLLISMSSCKTSEYIISDEECEAIIEQFFEAVENGDIETAINFVHVSVIESQNYTKEEFIDLTINMLLETQIENNVLFDDGISVVNCKTKSTALYDLLKRGGYKKIDVDIQVGDNPEDTLWATFEFLKNEDGFGIYDIIM